MWYCCWLIQSFHCPVFRFRFPSLSELSRFFVCFYFYSFFVAIIIVLYFFVFHYFSVSFFCFHLPFTPFVNQQFTTKKKKQNNNASTTTKENVRKKSEKTKALSWNEMESVKNPRSDSLYVCICVSNFNWIEFNSICCCDFSMRVFI